MDATLGGTPPLRSTTGGSLFLFVQLLASVREKLERMGSLIFELATLVFLVSVVALICSRIFRSISKLVVNEKLLGEEVTVQPAAPTTQVELSRAHNQRNHQCIAAGPIDETKDPDHPPNPGPDTCGEEGLLATASSERTSTCSSSPPGSTLLAFGPALAPVSASPDTLCTVQSRDVVVSMRSPPVARVSVRSPPPVALVPPISPKINPNLEQSSNHQWSIISHASTPTPFVEWTPFIPTEISKGGHVKKRNGGIDYCGGFSDVCKAEIRLFPSPYSDLKQDVALKILRPIGLDGKPELQVFKYMIARLNQEAITWMRLAHPNVVPLLGFTITPAPSLIAPWYEQGNIRNYLRRHPGANRLKLIYDVARGLEHLHSRSPVIVHGDVKPENVLISEHGDALISDFGLATVLGDECWYTPSHHGGGSYRYMSPELIFGEEDSRTRSCDIYSFASLAFEVLTGHLPHRALKTDNQIVVLLANLKGPKYPIDDWSKYPELEPVEDMLRRCWSQPRQRPSMKEIVDELSRLI